MVSLLPGWVVDDQASVQEEATPYVAMTPEQRGDHLARACRAAMRLLFSRKDWQTVLDHEDPLPESTVAALARLRSEPMDGE